MDKFSEEEYVNGDKKYSLIFDRKKNIYAMEIAPIHPIFGVGIETIPLKKEHMSYIARALRAAYMHGRRDIQKGIKDLLDIQ